MDKAKSMRAGKRGASSRHRVALATLIVSVILCVGTVAQAQSSLPSPTGSPRTTPSASRTNTSSAPLPLPVEGAQDETYTLGSGDKLKIIVYGEDDLGGEYLVNGAGEVQLPLLGQMPAAGMTIHDFGQSLAKKFVAEGYLNNPRVSVEVENYRPFYIIGEVKTPGQYPYVSGMNALNAIALSGGFSYRADDRRVYIRRNGSAKEVVAPADQTTRINPGDIIRVDERIF